MEAGVGMVRAKEAAGMVRVKEAVKVVERGRRKGVAEMVRRKEAAARVAAEGERPEGKRRRRRTCKSSSLHRIEFGRGRCSAPRS